MKSNHTLVKLAAKLTKKSAYEKNSGYLICLTRFVKYVLTMSLLPNTTKKTLLAKMKFVLFSPTNALSFPIYSLNESSWLNKGITNWLYTKKQY